MMGKVLGGFLVLLLIGGIWSESAAGPTYDAVQKTLDSAIEADSSRWMVGSYHGNLKISEAKLSEDGSKMTVKGSFQTNGSFGVATRYFNATLKVVLDSLVVERCCWQTFANTRWCIR